MIESELFGYEKGRLQAQLAQSKACLKQPIAARDSSMKGEMEPGDRMEVYLERIEQDLLGRALAINKNNQPGAAQQLGISQSGLIKKLKRLAHEVGLFLSHWCINEPTLVHKKNRK